MKRSAKKVSAQNTDVTQATQIAREHEFTNRRHEMATKKNVKVVKATQKSGPKPSMEVIPAVKAVKVSTAPAKPTAAAPEAAKPVAAPAAPKVSFDQIKARAYEVWLRKGCPSGQDVQNWEEAERELGVR
jgi:hypothetical protein